MLSRLLLAVLEMRKNASRTTGCNLKASEIWAAQKLLTEEGAAEWAQPCMTPLLDVVPFGARPAVVQEWTQLIKRLRAAVDAHHDNPTELNRMHMLGAWAIALRVFHPAVLRNTCRWAFTCWKLCSAWTRTRAY